MAQHIDFSNRFHQDVVANREEARPLLTDQIVVNLAPEDKSVLRDLARERDVSLAAVIRRILKAELARRRARSERLEGNTNDAR